MKYSDIKSTKTAIVDLDKDKDDSIDDMHEHLHGAERFMNLQNKVIAMIPPELFPNSSEEMMALNNLIYNNIKDIRSDIPREVITQWENMAPTRRKREVENPLHYT